MESRQPINTPITGEYEEIYQQYEDYMLLRNYSTCISFSAWAHYARSSGKSDLDPHF